MALAYIPPGVNVEELYSPTVNPLLAASAQVCLVGLAQGYQKAPPAQVVFPPNAANSAAGAVEADDDVVTLNTHDYVLDQRIRLVSLTGGTGLTAGNLYYVIAPVTANTFKLSATEGGASIAVTVDGTALIFNTTLDDDPQTITAPAGSIFQKVDVDQAFDLVRDVLSPTAGEAGTGQYVEGVDFEATLDVTETIFTITPTDDTDLDVLGATVAVSYRIVPEKYYTATRLDSLSAVEARYGPAFDAAGVATPLSASCSIAFENGASSLVIQPLFKIANELRTQPTAAEARGIGAWQDTFIGLRDIEDVNILVPSFTKADTDHAAQLAMLQTAQDHVRYMQLQGEYLVMIGGEDSVTAAQLQGTAQNLATRGDVTAEHTVVVSPSRFGRPLPNGTQVTIGGQYMAAAVAGMIAARPAYQPITRKTVSGFATIEDARDKAAKNADAAVGLMVVETKGTNLQVRHGLTVDTTSTARRELSVVRAKHRMIESIRDTVDTQIIGTVPADGQAPMVVKNAIISVLELLRQHRELVDYTGVQARTLSNDPTTVEVRFNYLPAFPLNYVNVIFSLDLTSGAVSTTIGS